MDCKKIRNK